jgi:hypothetical protein
LTFAAIAALERPLIALLIAGRRTGIIAQIGRHRQPGAGLSKMPAERRHDGPL